MSAFITTIEIENGLPNLCSPVCGATVFDAETGIAEAPCPHVDFWCDWAVEFEMGPAADPGLAGALERMIEDMYESQDGLLRETIERIAKRLPSSCLLLEIVEPARGGGHDGSVVYFAFDLALGEESWADK